MAEISDYGRRVAELIRGLNIPVREVERRGAWRAGFISDLIRGRKRGLSQEDTTILAKILGTTEFFLLRGVNAIAQPAPERLAPLAYIGQRFTAQARIVRVDFENGDCGVRLDDAGAVLTAKIVDPAFSLPHNAYARAALERTSIKVMAKLGRLQEAGDILFILDTEEAKPAE